ncbi:MAG: thioredoxin family protein [Akkermansiaceae bacterium]|nr:thioredoxin family protein [Akkermansiaceae bacterium]
MTHTRKRLVIALATASLAVPVVSAGGDGWMTDFDAAKAKAKKEGKDLLVDFTGSDWCGWCIKLDKEVFQQDAFKEAVPKDFILVELDFPSKKEIPEALKNQNKALRDAFSISGFPTVMLCDADGRPYAKTGYQRGGAEAYVTHLDELRKQKKQRDDNFAAAGKLEGPARARALELALSVVPPKCLGIYQEELNQIALADPDDASGFTARYKAEVATKALQTLMHPLFKERDFAAVSVKVDEFIKESQPTGEALQTAMLYKLQALYMEKKYDAALKLADEIIAINDTNKPARFSSMIKKRLERMLEQEQEKQGEAEKGE